VPLFLLGETSPKGSWVRVARGPSIRMSQVRGVLAA
jgi:hypothetical protein